MSEARIGWGAELQLSTTADEAGLVELGEVRSFGTPQEQADEHEVTHLKSPDRRKEFIQGMIDGGEVTATLNYIPGSASDILLLDALETGTVRAVRFIIPDQVGDPAWQITTTAFVKRYGPDNVEPNAPIMATLTLRVTGATAQAAEAGEASS